MGSKHEGNEGNEGNRELTTDSEPEWPTRMNTDGGKTEILKLEIMKTEMCKSENLVMEEEIDWEQELYGRGYNRVDWDWYRARKGDVWRGLETMSTGAGLMVDWAVIFGSTLEVIRPFLELTGERSESFPCPAVSPCRCRHRVSQTIRGEWIAACGCEPDCGTYEIEPGDVLFYGINWERLGGVFRRALGFAEPNAAPYVSAGLREIGVYAAVGVPVYLSVEEEGRLLRELTKLFGLRDGPFLVLTPTGRGWSAEVEAMARPHGGGHVSLAAGLAGRRAESEERSEGEGRTTGLWDYETTGPEEITETLKAEMLKSERGILQEETEGTERRGSGEVRKFEESRGKREEGSIFVSNGRVEGMLAEFGKRVASLRDGGGTLRSIHREIAAVRKDFVELRTAKRQLEKMLADGLFAFTRKVDPESFKVLCCVLAEGDVAKASRTLGMADTSVRTIIRRWSGMGKEYRSMLDLVRWRKAVGRKETVVLNDNVLLGQAKNAEYPELIADVLEKVTEMTGDNWMEKAGELEEMLRGS
jgi:hypothetical protein